MNYWALSLVAKQGQNKWKWVTNQSQAMREMKENEAQVSNPSDKCLEGQKGQTLGKPFKLHFQFES